VLAGLFAPLVVGGAFGASAVERTTGAMPALPAALTVLGFAGCAAMLARARGHARLAVGALILVLAQGLLGGLTVVYRLPPTILVAHLATSMIFFSTLLVLAFRLSPGAAEQQESKQGEQGRGLLWLTTAAIYLQILLGATVRHTGSGLVCTDLPLCRGALWPSHVHPAVHLHMAHRAFALVVAALVVLSAARIWKTARDRWTRGLALFAPALVAAQIALGVLTILTFKELVSVTGHLLVGALLLGCYVALLARARTLGAAQAGEAAPPLDSTVARAAS
jgi:heme A synthase